MSVVVATAVAVAVAVSVVDTIDNSSCGSDGNTTCSSSTTSIYYSNNLISAPALTMELTDSFYPRSVKNSDPSRPSMVSKLPPIIVIN